MIPFRMHVDPAPARTNEVQDEHGQLEPATLILFNAVLVDDPEIASSSIFDQGAVLEKAYCCYVNGGERVLATFVVIGILVTEVVPPVLLTWPTSWPTKLQLNIEQVCGTFGMQQCSGCFRFHFFKALYAAGLAWFVLAWVSLHTTAASWTGSSAATAIATTCRSKGQSNPDSSLESEDNNTWVGSSNEWNYQYCSWLGGDLIY